MLLACGDVARSICERSGAVLVQAVRPMAWMGRRSSLLARYAVDATRRPVAARHLTEEARAKGSVATTLETRGVTPPNGRHTQTPSTYNPVFVPLRRHPRPMALVSKCPRRKVGGFSARAARCPRRSTHQLSPSPLGSSGCPSYPSSLRLGSSALMATSSSSSPAGSRRSHRCALSYRAS